MSVQTIWKVKYHFEKTIAPNLASSFSPDYVTQGFSINGPTVVNVLSTASDPNSIAAILTANSISPPPGATLVIDQTVPADTPTCLSVL